MSDIADDLNEAMFEDCDFCGNDNLKCTCVDHNTASVKKRKQTRNRRGDDPK